LARKRDEKETERQSTELSAVQATQEEMGEPVEAETSRFHRTVGEGNQESRRVSGQGYLATYAIWVRLIFGTDLRIQREAWAAAG
jgi:hypothetical protein